MSVDEGEELVGKEREGDFEGGQVDEVGENRSKSVAAGFVSLDRVLGLSVDEGEVSEKRRTGRKDEWERVRRDEVSRAHRSTYLSRELFSASVPSFKRGTKFSFLLVVILMDRRRTGLAC